MPSTGHFRALVALSLVLGAVAAPLDTARADQCTRQGVDVTCDDGGYFHVRIVRRVFPSLVSHVTIITGTTKKCSLI